MIRTALRMASGFALALGCTIAAAAGPAFPNKEIRVLIAFPPGGPTDAIGRVIFRRVSIELGQPVIIENRPGAGGSIASQFVAKSKPDGYTLLFASSSFSTTPELYRRDDLVPSKAFKMVGCAATVPMLLLVPNNLKVDTPQQFLSLIKDKPDTLFMGSSGNGAIDHLTGMYMSQALDAKFQHVPYAGSGPALMDLVAGNVQFLFTGAFSTALPFIKDHRIKAIAVTSAKRSSVLPDVPTLDETIMKGFDGGTWQVLAAPADTPPDVLARLNDALNRSLKDPEVAASLKQQGAEAMGGTPAQCDQYVDGEYKRWSAVIRKIGLKVD